MAASGGCLGTCFGRRFGPGTSKIRGALAASVFPEDKQGKAWTKAKGGKGRARGRRGSLAQLVHGDGELLQLRIEQAKREADERMRREQEQEQE